MRYRLQRHDGTDCSATMVPITVLRMVPIQRYRHREQIKIYQGVLSKRINYIELYRVYDYEEKQSFIQSLINNTNIYIYSGDKSTPELLMNGLKANSDIIQTIRNRVEEQKKKKGIYEFTNR